MARRPGLAPWLYLAPALLIMLVFVVYPTLNTLALSLRAACLPGQPCAGALENYRRVLIDPAMRLAFRNNLLWIALMVPGTTFLGLVVAVLLDRVRYEALSKALIFLPMAISFVGAGVIWEYVYHYQSSGPQIGLLNALLTAAGRPPVPWTTSGTLVSNLALIVVGIWMWTGFCMTILSAAIKSVPAELIEAARVDGAGEFTVFRRILVPIIAPTLTVVLTTMTVNVLKIFDIVYVMGKGQPGTQVIATRMYIEQFNKFNSGTASAIAVILILAVLPIGYINIRRFRELEAMR
jgi:alpha-glucoside transport system permease protein